MSPPYLRIAAGSLAPVVLTCEHASRRLPRPANRHSAIAPVLRSHWGWDIGAWPLTRELARRTGASALGGRWSRLWVDLNRGIEDPTLIRERADGIELPWNRSLASGEIERRVADCHAPYHHEVDRLIVRRLVRGVRPLVIAVHSFTPELGGHHRKFEVGLLFDEHGAPAHRLGRSLRAAGLNIRYNEPYSGRAGMMYAAHRHGSLHRLPCLELELNQALFTGNAALMRIASAIERGLRELLAAHQAVGRARRRA